MRHVFFSFDWDDVWRVNQARFSWVSKGGYTEAGFVDEAEIETLKRGTDAEIRRWIADQLNGTSVTCVMIGRRTAESKWVKYEIQQSIDKQNGLIGIYIHNMKDRCGLMSNAGKDPFSEPPFNFRPAPYLVYPCCSYYDSDRVRNPIRGPLARLQRGARAVTDGPVATQVLRGGRLFQRREVVL